MFAEQILAPPRPAKVDDSKTGSCEGSLRRWAGQRAGLHEDVSGAHGIVDVTGLVQVHEERTDLVSIEVNDARPLSGQEMPAAYLKPAHLGLLGAHSLP